jgi:hypothetical protein
MCLGHEVVKLLEYKMNDAAHNNSGVLMKWVNNQDDVDLTMMQIADGVPLYNYMNSSSIIAR